MDVKLIGVEISQTWGFGNGAAQVPERRKAAGRYGDAAVTLPVYCDIHSTGQGRA
jgi:hypothetical protein